MQGIQLPNQKLHSWHPPWKEKVGTIESLDAASIVKVVLVRPMAITHQTDSEQKILEMPFIHDHVHPTRLTMTAPHGGHPHSIAQQGYYMMFAININGVPSVAVVLFALKYFAYPRVSRSNTLCAKVQRVL